MMTVETFNRKCRTILLVFLDVCFKNKLERANIFIHVIKIIQKPTKNYATAQLLVNNENKESHKMVGLATRIEFEFLST